MIPQKIIGNWKMNGSLAALEQAQQLAQAVGDHADLWTALCPPATLITPMTALLAETNVRVGAQTCHSATTGAHTGDLSAQMLAEAGATLVIVGHSERRADHGETSAMVAAQAKAALDANLHAVICVGETQAERAAGSAYTIVLEQVSSSIPADIDPSCISIAYEPVWAIGTGLTATTDDIAAMHSAIHATLAARFGEKADAIAILYGGSVKPDNAAAILSVPHVGGALVGGASLKAVDFAAICLARAR